MTPHLIRELAKAGALAGVVALSGCGSEEDVATRPASTGTPAPAATREASPAVPAGLRGSWKRTMTGRDWRSAGQGYPLGTWRVDVDKSGEASVYLPHTSNVDFTTQFVVKGRRLTVDSIPVCPGETGRYVWHSSAKALRLAVVSDGGCKPGAALFGGTWTRRH